MTWANRFKLFVGLIFVLAVVAAATIVFNQRQTHVISSSAHIGADQYLVGTDYGGIVAEAFVAEGDAVTEGDLMFTVRSMQLARDLATGVAAQGAETVGTNGTLVVRASSSGVVSAVDLGEGSFAGAGAVLATIDAAGTLFAEAEFILTPRDFGRIENDAEVTLRLPDGTEVTGTVTDITVETEDGSAHVTARIESPGFAAVQSNPLVKPGTPLDAKLELRQDGPLAGVHDAISDLARKIGL
jgi:multidrug resistance efflux pump